jgi:hypothetical protein
MPAELLTALEATPLAMALKQSAWMYAAVMAGHLLGTALLLGAIVPLDLRLLGFWSRMPTGPLIRVLVPTAAIGLALALLTGAVLFTVDAVAYAADPLFQAKLVLIAVAGLNILAVRPNRRWRLLKRDWDTTDDFAPQPGSHLALAGLNSLLLWIAVLVSSALLAALP